MKKHLHLDPLGGISGDMFIGAILDCWPELYAGFADVLSAINLDQQVNIEHVQRNDGVFAGSGFVVEEVDPIVDHSRHSRHSRHTSFADIRKMLQNSSLKDSTKTRAIDIFERLARAEAQVHGQAVEDVTFHEVGARDSIADITLSAHLIDILEVETWSLSCVPMGAGRIKSQHGWLPLPAPATLLLLEGLPVRDDGIAGERVTPTGAAILSHLSPKPGGPIQPMRICSSGTGFGTARFPDMANILRIIEFAPLENMSSDQVTVLAFEIDDQTPEDLAVGLDNLRNMAGVLDVTTATVTGKKGRQVNAIQVLCICGQESEVMEACFLQTTTLGVRYHQMSRQVLARREVKVGEVGVKIALRPGADTAKAEMDDIAQHFPTQATRSGAAHKVASQALDGKTAAGKRK